LFLGYGSSPALSRETLHTASKAITDTGLAEAQSWEDMAIAGRLVIRTVLDHIDRSDVAAFDVSTLNENVLFELGYAIARAKKIWLLMDRTDTEVKSKWQQFRLLSSVGYSGWANSEEITRSFLQARPDLASSTLYDDLIEPNLSPEIGNSIFYIPSFHVTEASRAIAHHLDQEVRRGIRLLSADPTESALDSLAWYAQKAYETSGTIAHFVAYRREMAWLHNARAALVVGLAAGFERPVLLLAEDDYNKPLDYQDLLRGYTSAVQCQGYVSAWVESLGLSPQGHTANRRVRRITELRGLRFGEHVAENESDLLANYFVDTAQFDDVLSSKNTLFVGRKGAGKTANMLLAASRLREDARNLVIVIKPQSYELEGLASLLDRLPGEVKTYTVLSLWNFLIQSEIAKAAVETIASRPHTVPLSGPEDELMQFVDSTDFGLREEFAVRFERTIDSILKSGVVSSQTISEGRDLLHESLHSEAIRRLRSLIGPVLKGRKRVAILIDNLDKAWDRHAELDVISQLLLGLLSAIGRVSVEYEKEDFWRTRISLTLATFLRSDIYAYLQRAAREPDKIPTSVLRWDDPALLLRVIEDRFLAARTANTDPDELWSKYFCPTVGGLAVRQYMTWRVLPRPRDIVYFCNASVIAAVNARHDKVEEIDIRTAEKNYSQFALEALLAENGITIKEFEDILFEFAGSPAVINEDIVLANISRIVGETKTLAILARLKAVSFLGIEVGEDRFIYPDVGPESKRSDVLARKFAEQQGRAARYVVHPAYRPYLEIPD
jgi:hypothetical protein